MRRTRPDPFIPGTSNAFQTTVFVAIHGDRAGTYARSDRIVPRRRPSQELPRHQRRGVL